MAETTTQPINLTLRDFAEFVGAAIGFAPVVDTKDHLDRCHAALKGGWISARKFVSVLNMGDNAAGWTLDEVAETFESLGYERPFDL